LTGKHENGSGHFRVTGYRTGAMSLWISGIGVSRGIGIGPVQHLRGALEIPEYRLQPDQAEPEVVRFCAARRRAGEQLGQVRSRLAGLGSGAAAETAAFIDSQLLMMEDRALAETVAAMIRSERCNAEAALRRQSDALAAELERMEDACLPARKAGLQQVSDRVMRILLQQEEAELLQRAGPAGPPVIVADDVAPADLILLSQQGAAAFITEYGGPLVYTAILARSLGVPAIVGVHAARRLLRQGETVIVDGELGHVLADPDAAALDFFTAKRARLQAGGGVPS
jgi:phosphotransferase system enzyme I (PtsI)